MVRWKFSRRSSWTTWLALAVTALTVHFYTRYTDERYRIAANEELSFYKQRLSNIQLKLQNRDREFYVLKRSALRCFNDTLPPEPALTIPSFFDFLPHLYSASPSSLSPALVFPNEKYASGIRLVIGVPTVPRQNFSYLVATLQSLTSSLSAKERESTTIVVMLADEDGPESPFVNEQLGLIKSEFANEIAASFLHVIVPPRGWYPPDLHFIPTTFGDPPERMYWRTKQNLDYVFLMLYCQRLGNYYLQLEDDVVTKPGFVLRIQEFIASKTKSSPDWLMLEFSSLGFIGKLFRTSDLPLLTQFIVLFHRQKPVDWLLDLLFINRYCHPEKSSKQCAEVTKNFRLRSRPSMFQHIGTHSSLVGKLQRLRERDFGKTQLFVPHTRNPDAKISTSLITYKAHGLESAYAGHDFFWSLSPHPKDYILFEFQPEIRLRGFLFRTGNPEHQWDVLSGDAGVYIKRTNSMAFDHVSTFDERGTARANFNESILTSALKIEIHYESATWLIINEIFIDAE